MRSKKISSVKWLRKQSWQKLRTYRQEFRREVGERSQPQYKGYRWHRSHEGQEVRGILGEPETMPGSARMSVCGTIGLHEGET